jgi:stalled ribosome alternative rescue factor ArfA
LQSSLGSFTIPAFALKLKGRKKEGYLHYKVPYLCKEISKERFEELLGQPIPPAWHEDERYGFGSYLRQERYAGKKDVKPEELESLLENFHSLKSVYEYEDIVGDGEDIIVLYAGCKPLKEWCITPAILFS